MPLVTFGNGGDFPNIPRISASFGNGNATAMALSPHRTAYCGSMWNRDRANKTLVGVGITFGGVTKASGSGLTITQEGVSGGPPYRPDGTVAQSWSVANGDASFAAGTWFNTSDNAGVAVAYKQKIAITVGYDGLGRIGSDSVQIRGAAAAETGPGQNSGTVYYNGTTWAALAVVPNVILKFSDGSFGTLYRGSPGSNFATQAYNNGSATDEYGLEFTVSVPVEIDGMWCILVPSSSADCDVVLYAGSTPLATESLAAAEMQSVSGQRFAWVPFSPVTLATGTTYRLTLKPTTANNITICYRDLNSASHRQAVEGFGESGSWVSRVDAGSWTPKTDRVPMIGLCISKFDDGTGGGSGGPVGTNFRGGFCNG